MEWELLRPVHAWPSGISFQISWPKFPVALKKIRSYWIVPSSTRLARSGCPDDQLRTIWKAPMGRKETIVPVYCSSSKDLPVSVKPFHRPNRQFPVPEFLERVASIFHIDR